MAKRLEYAGGSNQQDRMINDKLKSLKKAMIYSYQAATVKFMDGRKFKCLINPDKIKEMFDQKILSIPFEDICLNRYKSVQGKIISDIEKTNIKCGDIIHWEETNTD